MGIYTHNQKPSVSVAALSQADKDAIKQTIQEINDSMLRMDSEKSFIKDQIDALADQTGIDKKHLRRAATVYYKSALQEEIENHDSFIELYNEVFEKS